MSMIEVFKTNVETSGDASNIVSMLLHHFPGSRINFDLQDCDRILRVEGNSFSSDKIMLLLKENGFYCSILE
jgi:hypothetical protein